MTMNKREAEAVEKMARELFRVAGLIVPEGWDKPTFDEPDIDVWLSESGRESWRSVARHILTVVLPAAQADVLEKLAREWGNDAGARVVRRFAAREIEGANEFALALDRGTKKEHIRAIPGTLLAQRAGEEQDRCGHDYPGARGDRFDFTSDCAYGCGCWMGGSNSGGPKGVDPSGDCPKHPGKGGPR